MFALITRLKLICDGAGKFERLFDLLESIFASGESALIFTQYAKVGDAIRKALSRKFNRVFPYLHGALSAAARQKEIDGFNSSAEPSAFILSLRAGAFGLNLVKASHVIHFDRWWNPAVESQATDRAHRIGQTKTVFVHSFVTEGTLEERIDSILERKARVAGTLVGTGEGFLKSLSSEEFEEIVALDPDMERGGGA
jgi:SNF2 family DNA or RNA helicase